MPYTKYDGTAAAETAASTASLYGTSGRDTLTGTSAAESLWGGQGDRLVGGAGDDTYFMKSATDQVVEVAGGGVDTIVAWSNVYLSDYTAIENLRVESDKGFAAGNGLDNIIQGAAGSQQLYGGGGQDVLVGGAGADVFVVYKGEGNDVIQDFNVADGDVVRLKAGFTSFTQVKAALTQTGADVKLDMGGGDALLFRNITVDKFTAANFQLQLDPSKLGAMTFQDEFSAPLSLWDKESNPTGVWRPDFGYGGIDAYSLTGNGEKQIYTSPYFRDHPGDFKESPFVSNADGTLSIWAKPSTNSEIFGYGYTSGLITTKESFSQTYGYFEMRADLPQAAGAWPAFWLLPKDGSWPPELDIMETLSFDSRATWTTEHSSLGGGGHTSQGMTSIVPDTADGYHTYGALWTSTNITWYVDGVEVFKAATPADMNKPMYMLANMAMGGWGGAIDPSKLPAEMKIDYIRAYALGDGSGSTYTPPPTTTTPPPTTGTGSTGTGSTGGTTDPSAGMLLTATKPNSVLVGGAGNDTINASEGYDTITTGGGADTIVFAKEPWAPITIKDFQLGLDKLDLSALFAKSGYTGTNPVADKYVSFWDDGQGNTRVLFDRDGAGTAQQWPNHVIVLEKTALKDVTWAKLTGATDTAPPPVTAPPPPTGGTTDAAGMVLTATKPNSVLVGGAGNDTINASEGYDTITTGGGADTIVFAKEPWAPITIKDFQLGVDKLDLSALLAKSGYTGTNPVADKYVSFWDDGQGNTRVLFDRDATGTAQQYPNHVIVLEKTAIKDVTWEKISGGSTNSSTTTSTPTSTTGGTTSEPGQVLTATKPYSVLTGGAGNDTINASEGYDTITGGAGADRIVFGKEPWAPITIKDFHLGEDTLDLSALFAKSGYTGTDPVGDKYVSFWDDGQGNTRVLFDRDAAGTAQQWPNHVIVLEHVDIHDVTWSKLSGWVVG